jgi:hypothetical protein
MCRFKGAGNGAGDGDASAGSTGRHRRLPQPCVAEAMEEMRIEVQRLGTLMPPTPAAAPPRAARAPRATRAFSASVPAAPAASDAVATRPAAAEALNAI